MQIGATCVQGAGDRALATLDANRIHPKNQREREKLNRLNEVRRQLGELILIRLARLPSSFRLPLDNGGELVVVHGSPADPLEPFTHDMSENEIRALLVMDPADVVVCGGSHVPFDRTVMGVRIVNVGSVGEAPGVLPTGGAYADATFIEISSTGIEVEQMTIPVGKAACKVGQG